MSKNTILAALAAGLMASATAVATPAAAQIIGEAEGVHAGELAVPVNKSQVLRMDRPFSRALIGNPEIADVLPLTDQSLYVLGKSLGTTSMTLYDRNNRLIAVVDIAVGPDVNGLRRHLGELMPDDDVGVRMVNESIVLDGIVSSSVAADRAVQLAESYAPGNIINMMSVGSSQQVMLEVRFSEVRRSALKDLGVNWNFIDNDPVPDVSGGFGAPLAGAYGGIEGVFDILGASFFAQLDALERKGFVTTLAEPTLVALSGETASFLAGGEFPIPVAQSGDISGTGGTAITVEFKPFGVALNFTPTVLADGVINLVVAPEVSSIDPSASISVNGLVVPGLSTRRAITTVELRDGESFALAGLLRTDFQDTVNQFPILGSLPIIGSLFRSTGFRREETELVIIVTPRLVRPVPAGSLAAPTDLTTAPDEVDLFLLGRTDSSVPASQVEPGTVSEVWCPVGEECVAGPRANTVDGGMATVDPESMEGEYGHDY
ncbi:type II and III secretion system protein family protein [Sphingomicrobium clamense]|uniref:Type II and III secretion system protein family protein n=1 Tax=Sphingomicrobium clamense TaxID=2851013 RepID=A0ABS6V3C7_9SPHN|nr:type II and III secretion system protein family protein [Sphingomicrobium sp. B8]MBW0144057.1 type II and III secretion system protein family protein [Sphingomicrobium sp. B8]